MSIDPFGDMSALRRARDAVGLPGDRGRRADLLLVTHEHADHNGVEAIGGDPAILRSTAGTLESPLGEVVGDRLRARRGGRHRSAGRTRSSCSRSTACASATWATSARAALREEQAAAIGEVDLLFVPVGGGPTIGAEQARAIVERLQPRWVVPMHYRTPRIGFLEPADAFLEKCDEVHRCAEPSFETGDLPAAERPLVVVPAAP